MSIIENKIFILIMSLITVYALFGDDFRQLMVGKEGDKVFSLFNFGSLVLFLAEIVLASYSKVRCLIFKVTYFLSPNTSDLSSSTWIWSQLSQ